MKINTENNILELQKDVNTDFSMIANFRNIIENMTKDIIKESKRKYTLYKELENIRDSIFLLQKKMLSDDEYSKLENDEIESFHSLYSFISYKEDDEYKSLIDKEGRQE